MDKTRYPQNNHRPRLRQAEATDQLSIADALVYMFRYKWLFVFCVAVSLSIGALYILKTSKSYIRSAKIMIKDSSKSIDMMDEYQTFKDVFTIGGYSVDNQLGLLKSRRLMYEVGEILDLNISYKHNDLKKSELYKNCPLRLEYKGHKDSVRFCIKVKVVDATTLLLTEENSDKKCSCKLGKYKSTHWGKLRFTSREGSDFKSAIGKIYTLTVSSMHSIAESFSGRISVEKESDGSSIVKLSLVDENMQRAEDVLNTLIEVYQRECMEDKNRAMLSSARFIKERLAILEQDLDTIDSKIEEYKKDNRLTTVDAQSSIYVSRSSSMELEGLEIENQLNMVRFTRNYLRTNVENTEMIPASISIKDAGIQTQIDSYNALIAQKIKILSSSSERNPLVQDINNSLRTHRDALDESLANLYATLTIQRDNLLEKEQEYLGKILDLPTQYKELVSIQRQQKTKEELYLYLLNKKEENELQQSIVDSTCKVVDLASGPNAPIAPIKSQIMLIALMAGLVIPAVWIYLKVLLDTKVHSRKDLTGMTVPIIGELPLEKYSTEANVFEIDSLPHETFNEAMRVVRENLGFMFHKLGNEDTGRVVQILSYAPSAGKTFVSTNLALNIAVANKRVVLLDLDLRKTSLTRRFKLDPTKPGLSNYLAGESWSIRDITHQMKFHSGNIDVIPSGKIPPNPAELLKEPRLDELIECLRAKYDYVICDNPPYGMLVDAFVSSRIADASIYIVRAEMFDKRMLGELQELYNSQKLRNMSILLNGVNFKNIAKYYSYKYGYGGTGSRYNYDSYAYGNKKKGNFLTKWFKRK